MKKLNSVKSVAKGCMTFIAASLLGQVAMADVPEFGEPIDIKQKILTGIFNMGVDVNDSRTNFIVLKVNDLGYVSYTVKTRSNDHVSGIYDPYSDRYIATALPGAILNLYSSHYVSNSSVEWRPDSTLEVCRIDGITVDPAIGAITNPSCVSVYPLTDTDRASIIELGNANFSNGSSVTNEVGWVFAVNRPEDVTMREGVLTSPDGSTIYNFSWAAPTLETPAPCGLTRLTNDAVPRVLFKSCTSENGEADAERFLDQLHQYNPETNEFSIIEAPNSADDFFGINLVNGQNVNYQDMGALISFTDATGTPVAPVGIEDFVYLEDVFSLGIPSQIISDDANYGIYNVGETVTENGNAKIINELVVGDYIDRDAGKSIMTPVAGASFAGVRYSEQLKHVAFVEFTQAALEYAGAGGNIPALEIPVNILIPSIAGIDAISGIYVAPLLQDALTLSVTFTPDQDVYAVDDVISVSAQGAGVDGVIEYRLRVVDTVSGAEVLATPWSDVTSGEFTPADVGMQSGQDYVVSVDARDESGDIVSVEKAVSIAQEFTLSVSITPEKARYNVRDVVTISAETEGGEGSVEYRAIVREVVRGQFNPIVFRSDWSEESSATVRLANLNMERGKRYDLIIVARDESGDRVRVRKRIRIR